MLKSLKIVEFFTNRVTHHFKKQIDSPASKVDNRSPGSDADAGNKTNKIKLFDRHGVPTRALWDRVGESVRNGFIDTMKNNSVTWRAASYILHPVKHIKRALSRGKSNETSEPDTNDIKSEKKVSRAGRFIGRMASTMVSYGITDLAKYLDNLPNKQERSKHQDRSKEERVHKNKSAKGEAASDGEHAEGDKHRPKISKVITASTSYIGREMAPKMAPHLANIGERVRRTNQRGRGNDEAATDGELIPSGHAIAKSASKAASKVAHEAELIAASYVGRLGENLKRRSHVSPGSDKDADNGSGGHNFGRTFRKAGEAAASAAASDMGSALKAGGVRFLKNSVGRSSHTKPDSHEDADNGSSDYRVGKTVRKAGAAAASVAVSDVGSTLGDELGRTTGKQLGSAVASKGVRFLKSRVGGTHQSDSRENGDGDYKSGTTLLRSVSDVAPDLGLAAGEKIGSAMGTRAGSISGTAAVRYLGRKAETVGQNAPEGVDENQIKPDKLSIGDKDSVYKHDLDDRERSRSVLTH